MAIGLEQHWPGAVGKVTSRLVIDERAIGDEDVGGNVAREEREPAPRYYRLVQLVHRGLGLIVGGGVHVVVVSEQRVTEGDTGSEADLQGGPNISPRKRGGGGGGK